MFKLRFPAGKIPYWAAQYSYGSTMSLDASIAFMKRKRYLTHAHFVELVRWKSPRIVPVSSSNRPAFVEEVTRAALTTKNEQFSIEVLRLLKGVDWAVASTILHFGMEDRYPLLDYRALWSLGVELPRKKYSLSLWEEYTAFTRRLAEKSGVTMRDLDRALWQYSKKNQGTTPEGKGR